MLKNIALVFVVTLLILATGGVSIYHHICHCAGEMTASVFMDASCQQEDNAKLVTCCSQVESHSCCAEKPVHETKNACHDDDCCQTSLQFLKINDSFQPGKDKISLNPYLSVIPLIFVDSPEINLHSSILDLNSFNLPPPATGREILVSLHQLKLDTHPV